MTEIKRAQGGQGAGMTGPRGRGEDLLCPVLTLQAAAWVSEAHCGQSPVLGAGAEVGLKQACPDFMSISSLKGTLGAISGKYSELGFFCIMASVL